MISKEKMKDIFFYVCIVIFAITVWYVSYNIGTKYFREDTIPIGQEYLIKNISMGPNSSFIIIYYDNDKNKTERMIIPSDYNVFNFTESNSNTSMMKLYNTNGGVHYWNVFTPKK